jgi:NTE family protein
MRAGWLSLALALAAGCTWTEEVPPDRLPRFIPANGGTAPMVALVLGSGGPRGFAHIGVLKVLEENGIRPDLVIGSSVGAMVGALYAAGTSARDLERLAHEINVMEFFEFRMLGGQLATGSAIQAYVNERVGRKPIEALGMPFAAGATRLSDRKFVLFNRGDTGLAVRASSATPAQFEPVRVGSELYADADLSSPVPIQAARSLGARFVIAVDVSAYEKDTPPGVPKEWVENDARRLRQIAREMPQADVFLHPNIGYYAGHDEEYRRRVIRLAEEYTRAQMPVLKRAMAAAGQTLSTARIPAADASR